MTQKSYERTVIISNEKLEGDLVIPPVAKCIILFAHGSGSSRHSTRNQYVAQVLNDAGFATLLVDLLTPQEKKIDEKTRHLRHDIDLLANRVLVVTNWLLKEPETSGLKIGYFGSSTGAAAALISAANFKNVIRAIVCRGGRPDLAESMGVLKDIIAPVLFVVGGNDMLVIALNRSALKQLLHAEAKELAIIPDAGHLFEEPGKMEQVAEIAAEWFESYLIRNGRKFENRYQQKSAGFFSTLREKAHLQLRFKDRVAAGDMLAQLFSRYEDCKESVIVLGVPRGGVLVAERVARKLNVAIDILIPRKLRDPDNSEHAIGAIMQDDSVYLDNDLVDSMKISNEYLEIEKMEEKEEIERRTNLYHPSGKQLEIRGKIVILIDDGAATGATLIAATRWIRKQEPKLVVIGLPVAPKHVVDLLEEEANKVEVIHKVSNSRFKTVEHFYDNFEAIADNEVIRLLREHHVK